MAKHSEAQLDALRAVRDEIEELKGDPAVYVVTLAFSGQSDDSFHRLTRNQLEDALCRAFPWATTEGVKVACFEKVTRDSDPAGVVESLQAQRELTPDDRTD